MLATELFEKDRWGAFKSFITVKEAKDRNILPPQYHSAFPDICDPAVGGCGSEIIISTKPSEENHNVLEVGARVTCCNPRCKIKLGYTLHYMMTEFGCKNVGERTCLNIINYAYDHLELKSHIEVLYIDDKYLFPNTGGMSYVYFCEAREKIKSSLMTFPVMVSRLGIPGFDKNATKVLDGINGIIPLIDVMKASGGIQPFLNMRGVEDPLKIFYFHEFLQDILHAEHKVFKRVAPIGKIKIKIVATGRLYINGIKITTAKFIELCNTVGTVNGMRLFEIEEDGAITTTQFLICDYASGSRKYNEAKAREEREGTYVKVVNPETGEETLEYQKKKIIYTSQEFIEWLKGVVAKCSPKTEEAPTEVKPMEIVE